MSKGRIIAIEGTDGSGKQTQSRLLADYLKRKGYPVRSIHFPCYEKDTSIFVRKYLSGDFGSDAEETGPYTASVFFALDRYASYMEDWKQSYESGCFLISDRYVSSNIIHQGAKCKDNAELEDYIAWLTSFEYRVLGIPKEDRTIFLDMPPEYSSRLVHSRNRLEQPAVSSDIHEKDSDHIRQAYRTALKVAQTLQWDCIRCVENGTIRSIEDIFQELRSVLEV